VIEQRLIAGTPFRSHAIEALGARAGRPARLVRLADLGDQARACRRIFDSDRLWTVVRGSDLEEGDSQGLPVRSRHVGDAILASNITRRVDFAMFMLEAIDDDTLIREAPAIVGCRTPSALAQAAAVSAQEIPYANLATVRMPPEAAVGRAS
jgi:hypothetical protein